MQIKILKQINSNLILIYISDFQTRTETEYISEQIKAVGSIVDGDRTLSQAVGL